MSASKVNLSIENFGDALSRLEDVLELPLDEMSRDAVILRFTFVFELAWRTLRRCLIYEAVTPDEVATPREVLNKAYQAYWLEDDQLWLNIVRDRNLVVHTYNENLANEVYGRIKSRYAPEFRRAYELLSARYGGL